MLPDDGGPFGPPKAYHIPFQPIADPAAACACKRCCKMFALTKAAFPDLWVPTPLFPLGLMNPPRFPCLLSVLVL